MQLKHIDKEYGMKGLAAKIVMNNMVGVYSESSARDMYKEETMNLNSAKFVAVYPECNLYAMLLYFARYSINYKSTYQLFDIVDIVKQFELKFLPFWRKKVQPYGLNKEKDEDENELVGKPALIWLLAQRLREGQNVDDLRNCTLYKMNEPKLNRFIITEEDIQQAVKLAIETF